MYSEVVCFPLIYLIAFLFCYMVVDPRTFTCRYIPCLRSFCEEFIHPDLLIFLLVLSTFFFGILFIFSTYDLLAIPHACIPYLNLDSTSGKVHHFQCFLAHIPSLSRKIVVSSFFAIYSVARIPP